MLKTEQNLKIYADPRSSATPADIGIYAIHDRGLESDIYLKTGVKHTDWEFVKTIDSSAGLGDDEKTLRSQQFTGQETEQIIQADKVKTEADTYVFPDETAPIADPNCTDGWYFKNDVAGKKANWYFFSQDEASVEFQNLQSVYSIMTIENFQSPHKPYFSIYTAPKNDGNDASSWYRTRYTYSTSHPDPVAGEKFLLHLGEVPSNCTGLQKIKYENSLTVGPAEADEIILTIALSTNSSAPVNSIEFVNKFLGIKSTNYSKEFLTVFEDRYNLLQIKKDIIRLTPENGRLGNRLVDLSVNGGIVKEEGDGNVAVITRYQSNPNTVPSNFNNGTAYGNKCILGIKGYNGTPVANIPKVLLEYFHRSGSLGNNKENDMSVQFQIDLTGDGSNIALMLYSYELGGAGKGDTTVTRTVLGTDHYRHEFDINTNNFFFIGDETGMTPVAGSGAWFQKVFNLATLLSAWPNAVIKTQLTLDNGMPIGTVLPAIFFNIGGSTNAEYIHHSIEKFYLDEIKII